ncbi:NAD(P)/FAD-dependent oxidoreductase, partial [Mycobacteroides abscessus subsp. massiliense]
ATSLQLVPAIVDETSHLTVFQRTPIWVGPKFDLEIGPLGRIILGNSRIRSAIRAIATVGIEMAMSGQVAGPAWLINAVRRAGEAPMRRWMRSQVDDPVIREKLIPRYGLGCK